MVQLLFLKDLLLFKYYKACIRSYCFQVYILVM